MTSMLNAQVVVMPSFQGVHTSAQIAQINTLITSNITQTTAESGGNILSNGGSAVIARGVCWSINSNPTINDNFTSNGTGTGQFSSVLSGLTPLTTYYVRAYATNNTGTSYGNQEIFTTLAVSPPTVITENIINIGITTATGGGNIISDGGSNVTARGVVWSTTQNPTVTANLGITTNGTGIGSFTSNITGLSDGVTYYVRAYATNSIGTAYGNQVSFTTIDVILPTVITNAITNIAATTATLNGNVTFDGNSNVTAKGFVWATTQNPTLSVNNGSTNNGTGTGAFSSNITGLTHATTYYVRAYATNIEGTEYGNQLSFSTLTITLPVVSTTNVTDITAVSANSGGNVTSDGNAAVTARGIVWGTSTNPTVTVNIGKTTDGSGLGIFNSSLTGLIQNTTYYVRAYATNSLGTAYGSQETFSTLPISLPTISTTVITEITATSAKSGGNITNDGNGPITARGVVWGIASNPTVTNNSGKTTDGTGTGIFTSNLTNLTPLTYYYMRAYATNSAGTAYGNELEFNTLQMPVLTTNAVTSITGISATSGGNITNQGSNPVTARGIVWHTSANPTIDFKLGITSNGTGAGSFTSNLTGLTPGNTYYVKAYATSEAGTSYGNQQIFSTPVLPTVTTNTSITEYGGCASGGGEVANQGGATVTAKGLCWGTVSNPTINDSTLICGSGLGSFSCVMQNLNLNTTYFVRAFATNIVGTAYGNQVIFVTGSITYCGPNIIVEVTNPTTGKIWMDRNLGASWRAFSSTDIQAYGDLYQWGRRTDGHQLRTSGTTTTLSNSNTPGHGNFILTSNYPYYDWRNPQNDNLWQGVNGINNPCPIGYRIPTYAEWQAEQLSWSSNDAAGAFASPLKLPLAGFRLYYSSGTLSNVGSSGKYWSSSVVGVQSKFLYFGYGTTGGDRAYGYSVRCIKD